MKLRVVLFFIKGAFFSLILIMSASIHAQEKASRLIGFKDAQETFTKCRENSPDQHRGVGIVVNRVATGAIEILIAIETTKQYDGYSAIKNLEISVHPLTLIVDDEGTKSLVENGKSASKIISGFELDEGASEMIATPKVILPIGGDASAVRVRIRGVFGRDRVTILTANIDGDNTASVCYGKAKAKK